MAALAVSAKRFRLTFDDLLQLLYLFEPLSFNQACYPRAIFALTKAIELNIQDYVYLLTISSFRSKLSSLYDGQGEILVGFSYCGFS